MCGRLLCVLCVLLCACCCVRCCAVCLRVCAVCVIVQGRPVRVLWCLVVLECVVLVVVVVRGALVRSVHQIEPLPITSYFYGDIKNIIQHLRAT